MEDPVEIIKSYQNFLEEIQEFVDRLYKENWENTKVVKPVPKGFLNASQPNRPNSIPRRREIRRPTYVRDIIKYSGIRVIDEECMLIKTEVMLTNNNRVIRDIEDEDFGDIGEPELEKLSIVDCHSRSVYFIFYLTPDFKRPIIYRKDDYIITCSSIGGLTVFTNLKFNALLKQIIIENEV